MKEQNLSLRFYLNTLKAKAGKHPIYVRIVVNRKKVEIATDKALLPTEWNEAKQRAKKNQVVNDRLTEIEKQINDIVHNFRKDKKPFTAHQIKRIYTNADSEDANLLSYFGAYIDRMKLANEHARGSVSRYQDTKDHLEKFLEQRNRKDLLIPQVDYKFISDFDIYLLNQATKRANGKMLRNTANKHHTRLKTILIRAQREGITSTQPYAAHKMKYTPSTRTFLSQEELDKIVNYSFAHNKSLDKAKDIFIFSVYTGLRFVDAQNLEMRQIRKNENGDHWIEVMQDKTKEQISIPLLKPAINVILKYDNEERKITKKVLPRISNQRLNIYLKEIANIVGIEKELSHHVARHTCATTVLLANGAMIHDVSKWLGHNSVRTTQIYAKITNDYLQTVAQKIQSKI